MESKCNKECKLKLTDTFTYCENTQHDETIPVCCIYDHRYKVKSVDICPNCWNNGYRPNIITATLITDENGKRVLSEHSKTEFLSAFKNLKNSLKN